MSLKKPFWWIPFICLSIFISCESSSTESNGVNPKEKTKTAKKKAGIKKNYRSNGSLLSEISYVDGVKDGPAINYYPNGNIQLKVDYKEGKKNGKHLYNYQNGSLYKSSDYVDDELNGFVEYYREDGSLKIKIPYKNGKPGVGFEEYAMNGDLKKYLQNLDIVIREKNTVALNGEYSIYVSLSDYSNVKDVYYYIGKLTDDKFLNDSLEELYTTNGQSETHLTVEPGHYLKETITIVAEITNKEKHPIILKKSFDVSVKNN